MPFLIPLVATALTAVVIPTVASAIATLVVTGLEIGAVALLAPKPPHIGQVDQVAFKADIRGGYPYVVGRTGVGGQIVFMDTSNDGHNKWLHTFTVLSHGPVTSIEQFKANNVPVTFDGSGAVAQVGLNYRGNWSNSTQYQINDGVLYSGTNYIATAANLNVTPTTSPGPWQSTTINNNHVWKNRMWMVESLGAQPDVALAAPSGTGTVPEWGSSNKLSGLASARYVLQSDSKAFPTGVPAPVWVVNGPGVYDPRLDSTYPGGSGSQRLADETTWAYSDNPYLHALAFIIGREANGVRVIGLGAPASAIDIAAFVTGANVADTNGWKCGGQVFSTDPKWDVLASMLQAGGGSPSRQGALISCVVNTSRVSVATLTAADFIGPATVQGGLARRERINQVIPTYRDEAQNWQLVQAQRVNVAAYISGDGGVRSKGITYPLVQSVQQASQLAAYAIYDSRELGPISGPLKPQWMGLQPGDAITINEPEFGLTSQLCLITSRKIDPNSLAVLITCRGETTSKHANALGVTGVALPAPTFVTRNLVAPAPLSPPWSAVGQTLTGPDGTAFPAIVVTGTVENTNATNVVIRYRESVGPGDWNHYDSPPVPVATRVVIASLASGTQYDVGISYLVRGIQGAELVIPNVSAGSFAASGATGNPTPAAVSWANITASGSAPLSGSNAAATFTGINELINLGVAWTGNATLAYSLNGGANVAITNAVTNLILQSEAADNASWTKTNHSTSANSSGSPWGPSTADTVTRTSTAASYVLQSVSKATSALAYTFSIYVKNNSGCTNFALRIQGASATNRVDVCFGLSGAGSITSAAATNGAFSGASATITAAGGGWYRCRVSGTSDTSNAIACVYSTTNVSQATDGIGSSNSTSAYVWGAQLEQAAGAGVYVPTTSASVSMGGTIAVNNGDTVAFTATDSTIGTNNGTVTVTNNDDAGAAIGSFTYALTVSGTLASGTVLKSVTAAGSGSYTIDANSPTQVTYEIWGAGQGGDYGGYSKGGGFTPGNGSPGGGYSKHHATVTPGTTSISYTVGAGSTDHTTAGGDSTITSPAITAHGGNGTGGTATGGNVTNTTGHNGGLTNSWDGGSGANGGGDQTTQGAAGTSPGGGGAGGNPIGPGKGHDGQLIVTAGWI